MKIMMKTKFNVHRLYRKSLYMGTSHPLIWGCPFIWGHPQIWVASPTDYCKQTIRQYTDIISSQHYFDIIVQSSLFTRVGVEARTGVSN